MRAGCLILLILATLAAPAEEGVVRRFPLEAYRALGDPWLADRSAEPLFPEGLQARKAKAFRARLLAPWDRAGVASLLSPEVLGMEARRLARLEAELDEEEGFGPNFQPYDGTWLDALKDRLPDPGNSHLYDPGRRGITVEHAPVRLLPTADLYLHSHTLAGQGYPFDLLQNSVLWAGTPVYVLAQTPDGAWLKVVTDGAAGWVRAQTVALAGPAFVRRWKRALARRGLAAAIGTETPLTDRKERFRGTAFVGSVYPRWPGPGPGLGVLVPVRDPATLRARPVQAFLSAEGGVRQPWSYTPAHAAVLWKTLLGRPYGWGNLDCHNDCSGELKNFFTPFGLWLPRHSSDQSLCGRRLDLTGLGAGDRCAALAREGKPYLTLLWFPGHVMLYLGPLAGPEPGYMTYQNLWALRPKEPPDYRSIVGGSVLFPVLASYPERPELMSPAGRSPFFATLLDE